MTSIRVNGLLIQGLDLLAWAKMAARDRAAAAADSNGGWSTIPTDQFAELQALANEELSTMRRANGVKFDDAGQTPGPSFLTTSQAAEQLGLTPRDFHRRVDELGTEKLSHGKWRPEDVRRMAEQKEAG